MNIAGLQKLTLLDYPDRVACTVFLQGCNFRCPFCHNSDLLPGTGPACMEEEDFFTFLNSRKGLLDGVCITGGEPTLQKDLPEFIKRIKELGFAVKLDTNGSCPEILKALIQAGLVDYVAMDIKNSPEKYAETAGMAGKLLNAVEESIGILLTEKVDYEFRTTVVAEFHDEASVTDMGQWLCRLGDGKKPKKWFLQCYTHRDSVLADGLHAPEVAQMQHFAEKLMPYAEQVSLRGV